MSQSISQYIYKGDHSQALLFTMAEGQYLRPHRATVDILIIAATGKFEINDRELLAGEHIMFEKDVQHSVRALTDATFYLIKLAPHGTQN